MAITCNFDRDNNEHKDEKTLERVIPAQTIGEDAPAMKRVKHGAYLWNLSPRPRSTKSWREHLRTN